MRFSKVLIMLAVVLVFASCTMKLTPPSIVDGEETYRFEVIVTQTIGTLKSLYVVRDSETGITYLIYNASEKAAMVVMPDATSAE